MKFIDCVEGKLPFHKTIPPQEQSVVVAFNDEVEDAEEYAKTNNYNVNIVEFTPSFRPESPSENICIFSLSPGKATHLYRHVINNIRQPDAILGMDAWPNDGRHVPDFVNSNTDRLGAVYDRLQDAQSKDIFARILKYRLTGNYSFLPFSEFPEYFHPVVSPEPGDFMVDGGAEGSTPFHFSAKVGCRGRIFAYEPSKAARLPLLEKIEASPLFRATIIVRDHAIWKASGMLNFETGFLRSDRVVETFGPRASGTVNEVKAVTIDADFDGVEIDTIKLDVEGADKEALEGAINVIRKNHRKSWWHSIIRSRIFTKFPNSLIEFKVDTSFISAIISSIVGKRRFTPSTKRRLSGEASYTELIFGKQAIFSARCNLRY